MDQVQVLTAVREDAWDVRLIQTLEIAPGRFVVVRRCVDVVDLLATVGAGLGQAVLLTADLRRLDREALTSLRRAKVAVVGVLPSHDPSVHRERLTKLGVQHFVPLDVQPAELADVIHVAITEVDAGPVPDGVPRFGTADNAGIEDAVRAGGTLRQADDEADALELVESSGQHGSMVAIWGPAGAPGRTTLAVNIAMEAALLGQPTMLVDADPYGGCVAQTLGLLDEAPGLAGAARVANNGQLDPIALARYARRVTPNLHVLTGIPRASRWTELRPSALEVVWQQTRSAAALTVVDCGFNLEEDEVLSYDTVAPQRNGATLAALREADVVVAVGSGDPIGLGRLVRGLADLGGIGIDPDASSAVVQDSLDVVVQGPAARAATGDATVSTRVVVNRVRRSVAGAGPERQIGDALSRYAGVRPAAFIPDDPAAFDAALAAGRTLAEVAPRSPARQAVLTLCRELLDIRAAPERRSLARLLKG